MKPETVFRIVGFAFFAFATVMIYQGEFTEGKTGRVITRAHDPESFWAAVIILIGAGCVSLYYSRLVRPRRIADLAAGDDPPREAERAAERPKLPNYDPEFCGKVVKGAACVCVGMIIPEVLVLLHPSDDRCLSWTFRPHQPSAISLWVLVVFTVVWALWTCNMALRWDHCYSRWMYDRIASDPRGPVFTNRGWRMFMVAWCLVCAIPLFLILEQCTALSRYLNVLQF